MSDTALISHDEEGRITSIRYGTYYAGVTPAEGEILIDTDVPADILFHKYYVLGEGVAYRQNLTPFPYSESFGKTLYLYNVPSGGHVTITPSIPPAFSGDPADLILSFDGDGTTIEVEFEYSASLKIAIDPFPFMPVEILATVE